MRVLVAIPWRSQPDRIYAHDLTVAQYAEILPDAAIVDVDTDHEPFCLAGCRNRAVRIAEAGGYDVVVIGDADTVPEREPLLAAIEGASQNHTVHLPYNEYRSLGAKGTTQHQYGIPLPDCHHITLPFATSGVYVTSPQVWWEVGGQDERFLGWGMEDVAWLVAHRLLKHADPTRHEGRVYAFTHVSAVKDGPQYEENVSLYQRYLAAAAGSDWEALMSLIAEQDTAPRYVREALELNYRISRQRT